MDKIVFYCIAFFITSSVFSKPLIKALGIAGYNFLKTGNTSNLITEITESSKEIMFKSVLIDLQSLKYRFFNTSKVEKEDSTMLRLANDYLYYYKEDISEDSIKKAANACINLKTQVKNLNIPFIYIYAPLKPYYDEINHLEYRKDCDNFLQLLESGDVDVLNIANKMEENNISLEEAYFITDHHWNIETAFWAFTEICNKLKNEYNFEYISEILSLSNYKIKFYENWFLGSQGKKVGRYFTPLGTDNFSLITPKFETNLTVTENNKTRTGSFNNAILRLEKLTSKNYYKQNCYATYSGGDFPVQIIENNLLPDTAPKILIIRDSFACSVSPFLALTAKSIHNIDIRTDLHGDKCIENIYDYIKEYQPDYVMVLYSGLDISENDTSKYDF